MCDNFLTYCQKECPNIRYKQLACDPIPVWAYDVKGGHEDDESSIIEGESE